MDVDALQALEQAATPGPWVHDTRAGRLLVYADDRDCVMQAGYNVVDWREERGDPDRRQHHADAAFIVALRNAAPDLIAAARERDTLAAQVTALREALDHLYRATYESDEIIDGDCAGVVTRPNPEWRPFPSHDALRAALTDTAAAADAHDEHIRQAERERIEARLSELDECDVLSRYDRGDSGEGGPDVYFSMPAVLAIVEGRTDA